MVGADGVIKFRGIRLQAITPLPVCHHPHATDKVSRTTMSTPQSPSHPTPNPPRNDPVTTRDLSLHNGQDPSKPIWVAVKGTVFDVSRNKDAYGTTLPICLGV
jgi:hypothetical protein